MARQKKTLTTEKQIETMEAIVLQRKAAYGEAVASLKELRKKKKEIIRRHCSGRLPPANGSARRSWHSSRVPPRMLTNKETKLLLNPGDPMVEQEFFRRFRMHFVHSSIQLRTILISLR